MKVDGESWLTPRDQISRFDRFLTDYLTDRAAVDWR